MQQFLCNAVLLHYKKKAFHTHGLTAFLWSNVISLTANVKHDECKTGIWADTDDELKQSSWPTPLCPFLFVASKQLQWKSAENATFEQKWKISRVHQVNGENMSKSGDFYRCCVIVPDLLYSLLLCICVFIVQLGNSGGYTVWKSLPAFQKRRKCAIDSQIITLMSIFIKTECVLQQHLYPIDKKTKNKQTACLFFGLFESVEIEKWDVEGLLGGTICFFALTVSYWNWCRPLKWTVVISQNRVLSSCFMHLNCLDPSHMTRYYQGGIWWSQIDSVARQWLQTYSENN